MNTDAKMPKQLGDYMADGAIELDISERVVYVNVNGITVLRLMTRANPVHITDQRA